MVEWVDFQRDPDYSGTSNQGISPVTFEYKNYTLKQLDAFLVDCLNAEEISPQEIYDCIVKTLNEHIEYHRTHLDRGTELLSLVKDNQYIDYNEFDGFSEVTQSDWEDFWGDVMVDRSNVTKSN